MTGTDAKTETKARVIQVSTSTLHDTRSGAAWIASAPAAIQSEFLEGLGPREVRALPYLFEFWAHPHQIAPKGDWRTWVIMGGRGAGKTRAGAEWVRSRVEGAAATDPGVCRRAALVGETIDQVREVMIFGESGIMACAPPDRRPAWISGRKMLVWPNGAVAHVYSAHDPEALRGPQFDCVWADELAKWRNGREVWDNIQLCLRLGDRPQACVTTTPRHVKVLKDVLAEESTVVTKAPTQANRAYLSSGFLDEVQRLYAGTRLGRQELDGELLAEIDGTVWTPDMIEAARVDDLPEFDRIVVAVDPPVSGHSKSDECGILVVGLVAKGPVHDWTAYVIEDATLQGASPTKWAAAAVEAMHRHGADRIVAEVNQGGDMVESVLRQIDPMIPYRALRAAKGKGLRAEPVAALYEQGRVKHVRGLAELEDQLSMMTVLGYQASGSPDRADALVWAIYELMLSKALQPGAPRLRVL